MGQFFRELLKDVLKVNDSLKSRMQAKGLVCGAYIIYILLNIISLIFGAYTPKIIVTRGTPDTLDTRGTRDTLDIINTKAPQAL